MVISQETTVYQHVVRYDRAWTSTGPNPHFDGRTERCLRFGTAVQLCGSWAGSYHEGLVGAPISLVDPGPDTKVLVVGGGDWIAVDHPQEYDVTVGHVNLGGEFMRDVKTGPFFARWRDSAYEYDQLNTTIANSYRYLQKTNETYDLVLLDIPSMIGDDLLTLYSTEFYRSVRTHLSGDSVAVTWSYSSDIYPEHHKAFVNTVGATDLIREFSYWVHEDLGDDGETERVEQFYVLAPDDRPRFTGDDAIRYIRAHEEHYSTVEWHAVPHYRDVYENSTFHLNYDILIDT